jgi:hypothetical protein
MADPVVGLDLGEAQDYRALAIVEKVEAEAAGVHVLPELPNARLGYAPSGYRRYSITAEAWGERIPRSPST